MSISSTIRDVDLADLMTEMGTSATLTHVTAGGTFDPTTGGISGQTTSDYSVTGIIRRPRKVFMAGEVVTDDRIRFTITASGLAVVPTVGDELTISSVKYNIEEVETVRPAGVDIAYSLVLR